MTRVKARVKAYVMQMLRRLTEFSSAILCLDTVARMAWCAGPATDRYACCEQGKVMPKSPTLMSYNIFTFPSEAQMQLHIKIWEVHGPLMFAKLKENGCVAYSYNQVWNSPGTFKTSTLWEYESPEAFKACQQVIADYVQSIQSELRGLDVVVEASRNVIRHSERLA